MEYKKESAFPTMTQNEHVGLTGKEDGLTKREYFAAKAMQAILSNPNTQGDRTILMIEAVKFSDELLEALANER